MTHHGHLVKSWLTIEHYEVVVLHVPFNLYTQNRTYDFRRFSSTTDHLTISIFCSRLL